MKCNQAHCSSTAIYHIERSTKLQQRQQEKQTSQQMLEALTHKRLLNSALGNKGVDLCDIHATELIKKLSGSKALTYRCVRILD